MNAFWKYVFNPQYWFGFAVGVGSIILSAYLLGEEPAPPTHTYKNMDYVILEETPVNLTLDSLRCATERNQMKAFQAHLMNCRPHHNTK